MTEHEYMNTPFETVYLKKPGTILYPGNCRSFLKEILVMSRGDFIFQKHLHILILRNFSFDFDFLLPFMVLKFFCQ
jgi:hypothetical protein